jgi:hypothetical protein
VVEGNNGEFYRDPKYKMAWTTKIHVDNSRMHIALETGQIYENGNRMTRHHSNTAGLSPCKFDFWTDQDVTAKPEIC